MRSPYHPEALIYLAAAVRDTENASHSTLMLAHAAQPFLSAQARFSTSKGRMWSAAFSRNGQRIVTTDEEGAQLWDARALRLVSRLPHDGIVFTALFTPDDTKLLTAGNDGLVKMWDSSNGKLLHAMSSSNPTRVDYWQIAI